MIELDDPRRCLTCHGVHIGWQCPLTIVREPITDERAAETAAELSRMGTEAERKAARFRAQLWR